MKKRLISLILAIIMVFTAVPVTFIISFAEEITFKPTISAEDAYCKPGKSVSVNLKVSDNPGIAGGAITVTFPEELILTNAENGDVFENDSDYTAPNELTSPCIFTWDMIDGVTQVNGTLITLVFALPEEAECYTQYPISLSYRKGDFFNEEAGAAGNVDFTLENGIIEALDFVPGDVNDDGSVNGKDTRLIRQFNSSGYDVSINEAAADVNDDNAINGKDVRLLRRVIAGGYGEKFIPHHPACSHDDMTETAYKAATCTEDGNISYWYCENCDKYFSDAEGENEITLAETILPLDSNHHMNITEVPYKAPGCTEQGNIVYWTCTGCKKNFANAENLQEISVSDTILSPTGHTYSTDWSSDEEYHWHSATCEHSTEISEKAKHTVVIDEAVAADYEKTGLTEGSHCGVCGKILVAQQETEIIPYDYRSITYKDTKGADNSANPDRYCVQTGLDLQNIELNGYDFAGWYTMAEGRGTLVESIPKNSEKDYVLYAHFVPIRYTITYDTGDARNEINEKKYAEYYVNTPTFKLAEPTMLGFKFIGWKDDNGNYVKEIKQGSTGNIRLTPEFVNMRNYATPLYDGDVNNYTLLSNEDKNEFYFVYYLGILDNVVVSDRSITASYVGHDAGLTSTLAAAESNTVQQSISETTSKTTSWQNTESSNRSFNVGISLKGILNFGGSFLSGSSASHGESDTVSATTSNSESFTKSLTASESISETADKAGYYRRVGICSLDVFAVIYYNATENQYWLDTWSGVRGAMSEMWEYSKDGTFSEPEYELPFENPLKDEVNVITEKVSELVKSSAKGLSATVEDKTLCLDMSAASDTFYFPWIKDGVLYLHDNIGGKEIDSVKLTGTYDEDKASFETLTVKPCGKWENGVTIILDNMGIDVFGENGFVDLSEFENDISVTVEYEGQNEIVANNATADKAAQCAINAGDLMIKSTDSGSQLIIRGGNGRDGIAAGEDGTDGASAIIAENLTVDTAGELIVYGGDGGNGANGENPGQNGGNGGNGATAIVCETCTFASGSTNVEGGKGGSGADGATGSEGDSGKNAADATTNNGYSGGHGSTGGNGGNGGLSGNGITCNEIKQSEHSKITVTINSNGNGGTGGQGGNGGNGGSAGSALSGSGNGGNGGNGGQGGNGGTSGFCAVACNKEIVAEILIGEIHCSGNGGQGGQGGQGGNPGQAIKLTWGGNDKTGKGGNGGNGGIPGEFIIENIRDFADTSSNQYVGEPGLGGAAGLSGWYSPDGKNICPGTRNGADGFPGNFIKSFSTGKLIVEGTEYDTVEMIAPGKKYQLIQHICTWTNAQKIADDMGGKLISVNSEEERKIVDRLISVTSHTNYWIGMQMLDWGDVSYYRWEDGTILAYNSENWFITDAVGSTNNLGTPYTYWRSDQPDYTSETERYIGTLYGERKWNDYPDNSDKVADHIYGYIIEYDLDGYVDGDFIYSDSNKTELCGCSSAVTGNIVIPDGVTSISNRAFEGCAGLTDITIPESVTEIGDYCFRNCINLNSVIIGNGVKSISDYAFYGCSGLTSITIPASVMNIGNYVFCKCTNLASIAVDQNNKYYSNDNYGVLFNLNKTELVQYPSGNTRTSYTVPDSVTAIRAGAFYKSSSLTSVIINANVTSIGNYAFEGCTAMTSITIPKGVTSIGKCAFYECKKLSAINYSGTMEQWNAITKGLDYNSGTGSYVIHCSDGDLSKS